MEICVLKNYCSWDQHWLWGRDSNEGQAGLPPSKGKTYHPKAEELFLSSVHIRPRGSDLTFLHEDLLDRGWGRVLGHGEGELQTGRPRVWLEENTLYSGGAIWALRWALQRLLCWLYHHENGVSGAGCGGSQTPTPYSITSHLITFPLVAVWAVLIFLPQSTTLQIFLWRNYITTWLNDMNN